MSDKRGKGFRRNPGADSRAAPAGASARAAGGAAVVLERLADRGSVSQVLEGGRLRGDGRADDEVPGGRGGRDVRGRAARTRGSQSSGGSP